METLIAELIYKNIENKLFIKMMVLESCYEGKDKILILEEMEKLINTAKMSLMEVENEA
ncbi:MAG: hypothetical protein Q4B36_06180 [Tissierellia bacterium]|nr:hypothetical protein [Tissierellia bacterium]